MRQFIVHTEETEKVMNSPVLQSFCEQLYIAGDGEVFISVYPADAEIVLGAIRQTVPTATVEEI